MTHDVRTRCPRCGAWFWAGDAHTCPSSAVLAVAFPTHGLVSETLGAESDAAVLQGRLFRLALETFELDVQRVMWEQNVSRRTAVHVVEAGRRLDARKAEVREARAA